MGALSPLDGISPSDLKINELLERIKSSNKIKEIFLATNPTLEGDATADYISKLIQKFDTENENKIKITRISHGIPTGSAIEFAETNVLAHSIKSRTKF